MRLFSMTLMVLVTALGGLACGPSPVSGVGGRGGAPGVGGGPGGTGPGGTGGTTGADYTRNGPYPTTIVANTGPSGQYTIFRPRTLSQNGFKHPPAIWGCGIITTPDLYRDLLSAMASYGIVVVASNSAGVTAADMQRGLEWILQQNNAAGDYQGKLDVNKAISIGYSIGGTAAVITGAHPSVATTISIHGHTTRPNLHGPLLQTTGTQDTVGLPLQQSTYNQSSVQTFLATLDGATHFEILGARGAREGAPILAWIGLFILGDQGAKPYFYGPNCTLCRAPWTNPQRKNWPAE
jgi:hypothetical protein